MDIPFGQKVQNECNDYHYFFTYKKDRCPILLDKPKEQLESGYATKLLEDFEANEIKRRKEVDKIERRNDNLIKELLVETNLSKIDHGQTQFHMHHEDEIVATIGSNSKRGISVGTYKV